jgi:uncharacterized protein with ATP-grasp and redox domains
MSLPLDCIPCFLRGALEAARFATPDVRTHTEVMREALQVVSSDSDQLAPLLSQRIHRRLRELTGIADPYLDAKRRFNTLAMALVPEFRAELLRVEDPLAYAVRLAIAGNIIDLGVYGNLSESEVSHSMCRVLSEPFSGDLALFRTALMPAERILYLADNAGEIAFDRLLIEQLPAGRVTVAVRGSPVLNDATIADAAAVGLDQVVTVIDNGSDAPGTILDDCSSTFQGVFNRADVIIAKGQGNFETLRNSMANIFFLLKIKCAVVASHTGLPIGTQALIASVRGKEPATKTDRVSGIARESG